MTDRANSDHPVSEYDVLTPEVIREHGRCGHDMAGRLAAFAQHRAAGMTVAQAGRAVHVVPTTAWRYNRYLIKVCARLGLRPIPRHETNTLSQAALNEAGERGRHQRWHVARGTRGDGCRLCEEQDERLQFRLIAEHRDLDPLIGFAQREWTGRARYVCHVPDRKTREPCGYDTGMVEGGADAARRLAGPHIADDHPDVRDLWEELWNIGPVADLPDRVAP